LLKSLRAAKHKGEQAQAHIGDFASIHHIGGYGAYAALTKRVCCRLFCVLLGVSKAQIYQIGWPFGGRGSYAAAYCCAL
jgi:hypothetical protein